MARSRHARTAGNILQRVGRALSGGSATRTRAPRTGGRRTRTRAPQGRGPNSGRGLLRRLLS